MIKIEINGQEIEAEAGSMIIQVADKHDIPIPRFCYHPKLSIAANCRMCLVHVDKAPKTLPACATPISEGMKIWTASKQAIESQQAVMEFLLINHPLDCPICDQGGECELQDVSMQYGADHSRYDGDKRVVLDKNLGSLIATDLTRCIQCTRCVRFGTEIAGDRELGLTGRNEDVKIETFMAQHVESEVSGNVIDLCPVGALTSKPFRFKARAWELDAYPNISPHDCVGSNLNIHVRRNEVMRVVPREAPELNETWLADRDRFSYTALAHGERLRRPMVRKPDNWAMVSWHEALKYAMAGLQLVLANSNPDQLGVLASPNATLEEFYLLQALCRGLGSNNIDHRLRTQDFSDQNQAPLFPNLGIKINAIEQQDAILVIGSHTPKELPVIGLKLRKAALHGAKICVINPVEYTFNFELQTQAVRAAADMLGSLAAVLKHLILITNNQSAYQEEYKLVASAVPSITEQTIAQALLTGTKRWIVLGQLALMHPQAASIGLLANIIAKIIDGNFGTLSDGANAAGAWLAGCVPHRGPGLQTLDSPGKNALEMLSAPLKAYVLFAVEPEFDSVLGDQALATLKQADFVVAFSAFQSDSLLEIADVILPISLFAENSGTMVNAEGTWQTTQAVVKPFGDSKPAWKILRVLAHLAGLPGFEYDTLDDVRQTVAAKIENSQNSELPTSQHLLPAVIDFSIQPNLTRIAPVALYATDYMVRRALPLQATKDAVSKATIQMHPTTAKNLRLLAGDLVFVTSDLGKTRLPVEINSSVPEFSVVVYQAHRDTNNLGLPYAMVSLALSSKGEVHK